MKKAVLYLRVETREVTDPRESIKGQEDRLREYCKRNKIEVVKVYEDFASGRNFNRSEFSKFYLDLRSGRIVADILLFTSAHKFCSNLEELVKMHYHLCEFGITPKAIEEVPVCFIVVTKSKNDGHD
jgi:site-specific DNA recombinase